MATTKQKQMFSDFIGQEGVKKKLEYWIRAHNKGAAMPIMLFLGAKGHGKTQFAEASFKEFIGENGKPKDHGIVNCSQFNDATQFFTEFIAAIQGREITCLLDECHCLPKDVQEALLTPFNPNGETIKPIQWRGEEYELDLKKQTFILATTEPNKILKPLMERLRKVTFERYSDNQIAQIVEKKAKKINIHKSVLKQLAPTCRKSPRTATVAVEEMERFAVLEGTKKFCDKTWKKYCNTMSVKPFGLDDNEIEILRVLAERGNCSLGEVASALNMTPASVQRGIEDYLLNMRFIEIDGKRKITQAGREALEAVEAICS